MPELRRHASAEVPGLEARRIAADIIDGVLNRRRPLDEQLDGAHAHPGLAGLADRDRALVRMLVATVLRRLGTLRARLSSALAKRMPDDAPRLEPILLVGAAQIFWLDVPAHAAVDLAVRMAQADRRAARYSGVVNAVLRRLERERGETAADDDPVLDLPPWLSERWSRAYGADKAAAMAAALAVEPALDLTVKDDPAGWAARVRGRVLPTGTVRTIAQGAVSRLPGFDDGAWWVQDAAAALPARLLGDVRGKTVADLCAAPGGKTAQLAHAGAMVTAVDRSPARMARLRANLDRLGLSADTVVADAAEWNGGPFDAVLVDAPCASTGTIRRHPDIKWLKSEADLAALTALQTRLLDRAASLCRPGATLVYCVCSLEPEEGEAQAAALLERRPDLVRVPVTAEEVFGQADWVTPDGYLRTLPSHLPDPEHRFAGLDGFFAARFRFGG